MDVKNNEKVENENLVKEVTLGQKIVEGRKNKKLSQEKFAEKMGCTRQMVSRWELDQSVPRTQKIKKMSTILDISIEDLMGEKKIKNNTSNNSSSKKSFNIKIVIKNTLICVITIVALYLLYCGYKFLILNSISSKLEKYKNANNYHFTMELCTNNNINGKQEIWYKDGLYKIVNTDIVNNIEDSSTIYIDLNNGYRYLIDKENKTYYQAKLINTELYDNGKYMYSLFPSEIIKNNNNFKKLTFKINKVYAYYKNNKLYFIINDENIQLNKDTFLPISQTIVLEENQIVQKNYNKFNIELNNVTDEDVKVPDSYTKTN